MKHNGVTEAPIQLPRNPALGPTPLLEFQHHLNPKGEYHAFVQLELIFLTPSPLG